MLLHMHIRVKCGPRSFGLVWFASVGSYSTLSHVTRETFQGKYLRDSIRRLFGMVLAMSFWPRIIGQGG